MSSRSIFYTLIISLHFLVTNNQVRSQVIDSFSVNILSRNSFYSFEKEAEILVHLPSVLIYSGVNILIRSNDSIVGEWSGIPTRKIIRIPVKIADKPGFQYFEAEVLREGNKAKKYISSTTIQLLEYKPNEVKTDRFTGSLIVNKKPFFPVGFYCYSPVYPTLPEEEAVNGFNMISPYQKILPETFEERKAYMDKCARVGIRVHYNLLSVAGGGGVNSKLPGISEQKKREMLINEIKAFMDHPALLAWYIADEPNGYKTDPAILEDIYKCVRETDPWHPVSIVFMAPFLSSRDYANALDIVMADPYPVPVLPPSMVGDVARQLVDEFRGRKSVWMVPQAFGGGEYWEREPTPAEIRSMTWQSVVRGVTGIQYFVRQGPNSFPKSTLAWAECSRAAIEISSISPWLLSDEESPGVIADSKNIIASSRMYRGRMIVMAVNSRNENVAATIRINKNVSGKADVMFENRQLKVTSGIISDHIPPYGRAVYMVDIDQPKDAIIPYKDNYIKDPGFENITTPGIPSAVYARNGPGRGATIFTDPTEQAEGRYSVRMTTPEENNSMTLRFYPVTVVSDRSYMISVWAKSDPERRASSITGGSGAESVSPQYVEIGFGEYGKARFTPTSDWKEYVTFITIPPDSLPKVRVNVTLRMPGQGVAWFDMVQVIEDPVQGQFEFKKK